MKYRGTRRKADAGTPNDPAVYRIDGDPMSDSTLAEFKKANADAPLPRAVYSAMSVLGAGKSISLDLGAGGLVRIKRVR